MRSRFIGILAILAMIMAFAAPVAADAPNDCPDPEAGDFADASTDADEEGSFTIDGTTVYYVVSDGGQTISFFSDADHEDPISVEFCVKGGSAENSGVQTGSTFTVDFENGGGQNPGISNFVVYGVALTPTTAAAASVTAPSCTAAGMLEVPEDTDSVAYSVSDDYEAGDTGTFTVTATAKPGFVLEGPSEWELTVLAQLTGDACAAAAVAAAASITGPSCTAAGTLVVPANTASVTYGVSPAYSAGATGTFTVTATANAGFLLNGTSQWMLTVAPKVTGAACVSGGGTLGGNPPLPNTAMDAPATDQMPASLIALLALSGLAYVGRRNLLAMRNGS
jgi:hypothetical protein